MKNQMTEKNELVWNANGNQLGQGREARMFFEMRGFANRRPGQQNIGDCALWHAFERAVARLGNVELQEAVNRLNKLPFIL